MDAVPADRRAQLRVLSRHAKGGVVSVGGAAKALGETTRAAALRLARFARSGWILRVRRGLYFVPPLDAGPHIVADDAWILADALFSPCYLGGWSAAEHWGLTEQIFRSTFVATATHIKKRTQVAAGSTFHLTRVAHARIDSVPRRWRGSVQLRVSDAERTVVDALMDPSWVGGVRHLGAVLVAYRDSKAGSAERLTESLERHGNGASHKRAGYLTTLLWPDATLLLARAAKGKSAGVVKLDPSIASRGVMNKRWGLWINVRVSEAES